MPERVLNQIKYLCRQIAKVEWSGVLFYSVEGSIKDPANMVLTLQDILPMHKGTGTYTEYTFDERVVDYMMDNEVMEKGWKMGHIHSHNTMGVFFSGTDWSELEDNAPNHNFYLSLIVNNFMDFCAKVCFIVDCNEQKEFTFSGKDENGERYVYTTESYEVPDKKLVVYDCDINSPAQEISVNENFSTKVAGIIEAAEKRATVTKTTPGYHTTSFKNFLDKEKGGSEQGKSGSHQQGKNGRTSGGSWSRNQQEREDAWGDTNWNTKINEPKASKNFKNGGPKDPNVPLMFYDKGPYIGLSNDEIYNEVIEKFAMYVVNGGNSTEEYGDIDDITEMYLHHNVSGKALASTIMDNYSEIYDAYFEELADKDIPTMFANITNDVIDCLECECDINLLPRQVELIKPVISSLQNMMRVFGAAEVGQTKL